MNYYYVKSDRAKVLDIRNRGIGKGYNKDVFSVTVKEGNFLNLPTTISYVEESVMIDKF